ncbi:hypothetical protein OY671_008808, partial [Metschnikowia pulcherrima]
MSIIANAQPWSNLVISSIVTITGFSISSISSVIYRASINRRPIITWGVTAVVSAIAVGIYAFIDSWVSSLYRPNSEAGFAQRFVGVFYLDLTSSGAWSALYYAINFFSQVEEQNDQSSRSENQATSAQLAMSRYQLNPHFSFNTLNSSSASVMTGRGEQAERMIQTISSFYRHSSAADPTSDVPSADEIASQRHYLEIEAVRFPDRSRTEFDVPENLAQACVPGMISQPSVENSIKYA